MRSNAASTRRALVAGQLLTEYEKGNVESRSWQLAVFDPISDHFDGEPFGAADGLPARLPVGHDAGQFQRLGNPAAVIFPVEFNGDVHSPIVGRTMGYIVDAHSNVMLDPALLTQRLPTELWIELTSKCPFDCVFCSRRWRRSEGEHMDFGLYRSLIGQLESPEVIRLNYSGESIHYPHLIEAVQLAAATGARTELVSALASAPPSLVRELATSGLGRLSVSVHTLDEKAFKEIYGLSSVDQMRERITQFLDAANGCSVDLAFVAMERNLNEIPRVAAYARESRLSDVFIHPVIRRDPIPVHFPHELDGRGRLRESFGSRLRETVEQARRAEPRVRLTVCHPGLIHDLPAGEGLSTCEQNPWETIHILANGDVVACEVHDSTPLGNLRASTLVEIWRSPAYSAFRRRYLTDPLPQCRSCPWKAAQTGSGGLQLVAGWHARETGITWSKARGLAVLDVGRRGNRLRLRGVVPPATRVEVRANGALTGTLSNRDRGPRAVGSEFRVDLSERAVIEFRVEYPFIPARAGLGEDIRRLGFGLVALDTTWRLGRPARALGWAAAITLSTADRLGRVARLIHRPAIPSMWHCEDGISIVIPERANPELLKRCLEHVMIAAGALGEPYEVIVVVNGSARTEYKELEERYANHRWLFCPKALGFCEAVRRGLACANHDWVYLLNNDMFLEPDALRPLLEWRREGLFAIASQIVPAHANGRREETNWTDWRFDEGVVTIADVEPESESIVRGSLYAGGGSALFRKSLLEIALAECGDAYDPVYWEDAEWGVRMRKRGFQVLFCPKSRAVHVRRATVNRFYKPEEVMRIFERNRLLFHMRNVTRPGSLVAARRALAHADPETQKELLRPGAFWQTLVARFKSHLLPFDDQRCTGVRDKRPASPGSTTL